MDKLQDSFGGTSINTTLWIVEQIHGTATESGATLNLAPDANTGASSVNLYSVAKYSMSGSQLAVKVPRVPSSAGNVDTQVTVYLDDYNLVQWYYANGYLYAYEIVGGVKTQLIRLNYSATNHLWWRIRESDGDVKWETSADGAVYTIQAAVSTSSLFAITAVQAVIYAETFNTGLSNPGQASFANLNVAPSGVPAMASLVDTFGGTSLDPRGRSPSRRRERLARAAAVSTCHQPRMPERANSTFSAHAHTISSDRPHW